MTKTEVCDIVGVHSRIQPGIGRTLCRQMKFKRWTRVGQNVCVCVCVCVGMERVL